MHSVDPLIADAVLQHVTHRLHLDPAPLGRLGGKDALDAALSGLITEDGRDVNEVLKTWTEELEPTIVSCDSPRFLSFIPGAPAKTAALFDMVLSAASLHGVSWLEASGAIAAENQVLELLASRAGLPTGAGGTFVSGGSAGNLSAIAVARNVGAERRGIARHEARIAVSDQVHSSVTNTLSLLGMSALIVPTPDYRLTAAAVQAALDADPRPETVVGVIATAGTTNAGIIDELREIGNLAQSRNMWFHVDGAYGGALLLSDTHRGLLDGIGLADSIVIDPHKWLFAPFDCGALLFRDPHLAKQTHSQEESYLDVIHANAEWNPSDYAYQLTRRPRGLPLWFSLAVHGTKAYSDAIDRGIDLAQYAGRRITATPGLELVRDPHLSVVVFRHQDWTPEDYEAWSHQLLADDLGFVVPSSWEGEPVLRFAILHPGLTEQDLDLILDSTVTYTEKRDRAAA